MNLVYLYALFEATLDQIAHELSARFTWECRSAGFDDDAIRTVFFLELQKSLFHLTDKDAAQASIGHLLHIDVVQLCDL